MLIMPKTFIFCGPPGAGKDTQASFIVERNPDFLLIASGTMFRDLYRQKNKIGLEAAKYWLKGNLVPDDLYAQAFEKWLKSFDPSKNWLLIGAVRSQSQVVVVDTVLSQFNKKIDKVICLEAKDNVIIRRITNRLICPACGRIYNKLYNPPKNDTLCDDDKTKLIQRKDDTLSIIKNRLDVYHKLMRPVIEEYEKRGILYKIDAERDFETVYKDVKAAILGDK